MLRMVPVSAGGAGEAAAAVLLGPVDDRTLLRETNDTGQAERATEDILGQSLQTEPVARCQADAVVDAEARVGPGAHCIGGVLVDLPGRPQQVEYFGLPGGEQAVAA